MSAAYTETNLKHPPTKQNETRRRIEEHFERGMLQRVSPEWCAQLGPRRDTYIRNTLTPAPCLTLFTNLPQAGKTRRILALTTSLLPHQPREDAEQANITLIG